MDWKPVGDKVIARKNRVKTHGMIVDPSDDGTYDGTATVIGVGHAAPFELKPGDQIVVSPHGGVLAEVFGKDIVILFPQEILARGREEAEEINIVSEYDKIREIQEKNAAAAAATAAIEEVVDARSR